MRMAEAFQRRRTLPRWARIACAVGAGTLVALLAILTLRWPYSQERLISALEGATGSRVAFQKYDLTFFPHPGCTIEQLEMKRQGSRPIAKAARVFIQSSWWSVLTLRKHIRLVKAEGLTVQIPSPFPPPVDSRSSGGLNDAVIAEVRADGATLDFVSASKGTPARYLLHSLRVGNIGKNRQMSYSTVLDIPNPPGQVKSSGTVGPVDADAWERTDVSGSFELHNAALDRYAGLAGKIDGQGTFRGRLHDIRVDGTAVASEFEVNRTGHPLDLWTDYKARVDAVAGNVFLDDVKVQLGNTHLAAKGSVAGQDGKTVSVQFTGGDGRIEDLLSLFTRSDPPALAGTIDFRAAVELPPGEERFIERLRLRGVYDIRNARWMRKQTRLKVNSLSARARGDKKQVESDDTMQNLTNVLTQLRGEVVMNNAIASLSRLSFRIPGAEATGAGTYNLKTKHIDLKGTVSMAADVSEATSGIKSFLLKPFDALFRRKKEQGATLPVRVTGRYPRPRYTVGLTK